MTNIATSVSIKPILFTEQKAKISTYNCNVLGFPAYKVERKAFSTIEFECLLKQTEGGKYAI